MIVSKVVNLTPHQVNIIFGNENLVIEPSGIVVRLAPKIQPVGNMEISIEGREIVSIPLEKVEYGDPIFVKDGKTLTSEVVREIVREEVGDDDIVAVIVPQLLAHKARELMELFSPAIVVAPNTNKAVRDEQGRIQGVKGLLFLSP